MMYKVLAVVLCTWLATAPATAGPMELLTDTRGVGIGGKARTVYARTYEGKSPEVTEEIQKKDPFGVLHPVDSYGAFSGVDTMTLGTAYATTGGRVSQVSSISSSVITFEGVVDVSATRAVALVFGPDYVEEAIGGATGSGGVFVRSDFTLGTQQLMDFSMNMRLTPWAQNDFQFSLVGDNGFAWTNLDANNLRLVSFTTQWNLAPGTYTLHAALSATAIAPPWESHSVLSTATFSLMATPVPEPASWQLALLAGAFVWARHAHQKKKRC
jgi:hypothetical protein